MVPFLGGTKLKRSKHSSPSKYGGLGNVSENEVKKRFQEDERKSRDSSVLEAKRRNLK